MSWRNLLFSECRGLALLELQVNTQQIVLAHAQLVVQVLIPQQAPVRVLLDQEAHTQLLVQDHAPTVRPELTQQVELPHARLDQLAS